MHSDVFVLPATNNSSGKVNYKEEQVSKGCTGREKGIELPFLKHSCFKQLVFFVVVCTTSISL